MNGASFRCGHELGGEGGCFDVRVLASRGEPVERLCGPDVVEAHEDAFGLIDDARAGVGVDEGGGCGVTALDGQGPGQVDGQAVDGGDFSGVVPVCFGDGEDLVFFAVAVDDAVEVGCLAAVAGEGLDELPGCFPVFWVHVGDDEVPGGDDLADGLYPCIRYSPSDHSLRPVCSESRKEPVGHTSPCGRGKPHDTRPSDTGTLLFRAAGVAYQKITNPGSGSEYPRPPRVSRKHFRGAP